MKLSLKIGGDDSFFFLQCGINGVERGAWASSAPRRGLPTKTTRRAAILDERSLFFYLK